MKKLIEKIICLLGLMWFVFTSYFSILNFYHEYGIAKSIIAAPFLIIFLFLIMIGVLGFIKKIFFDEKVKTV